MNKGRSIRRAARGFTMLEIGVALLILAATMVLVVQMGYWSVRHRARTAARFAALELANNELEQALAVPWDSLTDQWGESRTMSGEFADQLTDGTMSVRVKVMDEQPLTKQVEVVIRWLPSEADQWRSVRLIGFYSSRAIVSARDPE